MKKYIQRIGGYIAIQIIFYLLYAITIAFLPYLNKLLFENIIQAGMIYFLKLVVIFFLLTCMSEAFCYISEKYVWKTAIHFEQELKKDFYLAVSHKSLREFGKKDVGNYISIQGNDITVLEQDYLTPLVDVIKSVILIAAYGLVLLQFLDVSLGILLFGLSVIAVLVPKLTAKELSERRKSYMAEQELYLNLLKELFENHSLVNDRTRGNFLREHHRELEKVSERRYRFGRFKCASMSLSGLSIGVIHTVAFFAVGYRYLQGNISVGTAVAVLGYVECFLDPLQSLVYDVDAINSSREIRKKIMEFLKVEEDGRAALERFDTEISYENVSVKYKDVALSDFSYLFKKGKKYAIVGPSGAGKSTILRVLLGNAETESGRVLLDGKDIAQFDTSRIISDISQADRIFKAGYEDNVSVFGTYAGTAEEERLWQQELKRYSYLRDVPDCTKLSGGEKKIISYIRMLRQNTEIVLLDEPFSALDYRMSECLMAHLMSRNKTVIVITHDVSMENLAGFDAVLHIKDGRLEQKSSK